MYLNRCAWTSGSGGRSLRPIRNLLAIIVVVVAAIGAALLFFSPVASWVNLFSLISIILVVLIGSVRLFQVAGEVVITYLILALGVLFFIMATQFSQPWRQILGVAAMVMWLVGVLFDIPPEEPPQLWMYM